MKAALAIYNQLQHREKALRYLLAIISWNMDNESPKAIHRLEQLETELLDLKTRAEKALAGTDVEEMRRALEACRACTFMEERRLWFGDPFGEKRVKPLFERGALTISERAMAMGDIDDFKPCLLRHFNGDWGDVSDETRARNQAALTAGGELISKYQTPAGRVLIYTHPTRTLTSIILPDEINEYRGPPG